MTVTMPSMHEDVHQGTGGKHQERQGRRQMGAVPDYEIATQENGEAQHNPATVGRKAVEHDHPPS
jgi:hypothetical protein